jgi:FdhE protein
MQRVLDPTQIEISAQRTIPRTRLPDRSNLFATRAARLRALARGNSVGEYLQLMAAVCDAQQVALASCGRTRTPELEAAAGPIARARQHGLPPLPANGWPRDPRWRAALATIARSVAALPGFPSRVTEICGGLVDPASAEIEVQADRLLAAQNSGVQAAAAPFVMAALQVYWADLAGQLKERLPAHFGPEGPDSSTAVVCPTCGTLPVASIVRADGEYNGYRYLHCGLCATEWHLVRIKCTHCLTTAGIRYHFVENASDALRAESCDGCHTYRKILYHEKDPAAEPVADDLASLALDLLMTADGFQRASGNPLLWQATADP